MPSVSVKLYSAYFKTCLRHKLLQHHQQEQQQQQQNSGSSSSNNNNNNNREDEHIAHVCGSEGGVPAHAAFVEGVASKDINVGMRSKLSLRIFLPQSALPDDDDDGDDDDGDGDEGSGRNLSPPKQQQQVHGHDAQESRSNGGGTPKLSRRVSDGFMGAVCNSGSESRRSSWGGELLMMRRRMLSMGRLAYANLNREDPSSIEEGNQLIEAILEGADRSNGKPSDAKSCGKSGSYQGYVPRSAVASHKKLPIILQFHGGGFVCGSKDSAGNDLFCRRMAKLCDAIVIAVGYRLALEHKFPAAFDDGFEALSWLAQQANLADCSKSIGLAMAMSGALPSNRRCSQKELIDTFSRSMAIEPWLAAHGDTSRCVLLGMSSGANIADYVARKAVRARRMLEPVKMVAQVLMYPFFIGSAPTPSEMKLANAYFFDRPTCIMAWKLFFGEEEFNLDHPVANPLVEGREPPLKQMPPTLTVVGELDWMKERAIAYSEALRKANLDAPLLEYKDGVHEFADLDMLAKSRQAQACAEDMTIWMKKYISQKGHELSY